MKIIFLNYSSINLLPPNIFFKNRRRKKLKERKKNEAFNLF